MTPDEDPLERDWSGCDWCLSKTCAGAPTYPRCGGPSGPGIDEPEDGWW